ncbi:MAG: ATP-binding protein [Pseudomonadota bacterium]
MAPTAIEILLIDDDEGDALITRDLLEQAAEVTGSPIQVAWTDTYRAGLASALQGCHDLVLVDYQLNPGSGLDLIREARQAGCATPFILLTGMSDHAIDQQALCAGAADFLVKGVADAALLERSIRYSLERARTLACLAAKTRELERSNLELEMFARAVSHDLRQPLHIISGYAELLSIRYQDTMDDRALDMMSRIMAGVDRMNRMIEDLLSLSRLDAAGERVVEVDCSAVVAAVMADLQPRVEAADAHIEIGPLPRVRGRAAHLEQLFRNLLGNALKFVSEISPRISVSCARQEPGWRFIVSDNGLGVPEPLREAIFEPFRRGDGVEGIAGTGVGLALCTKIVGQHGGRLWVEPGEGGGSRFCFTLWETREPGHAGSGAVSSAP